MFLENKKLLRKVKKVSFGMHLITLGNYGVTFIGNSFQRFSSEITSVAIVNSSECTSRHWFSRTKGGHPFY